MSNEELLRLKMELVNSKQYLSIFDVSLLSGYSISTIRRRIEEGKLKSFQEVPKGKVLLKRADVDRWIENGAR